MLLEEIEKPHQIRQKSAWCAHMNESSYHIVSNQQTKLLPYISEEQDWSCLTQRRITAIVCRSDVPSRWCMALICRVGHCYHLQQVSSDEHQHGRTYTTMRATSQCNFIVSFPETTNCLWSLFIFSKTMFGGQDKIFLDPSVWPACVLCRRHDVTISLLQNKQNTACSN